MGSRTCWRPCSWSRALAGAVLLWRRFGIWAFAGVAALSLVTVGGSSFGADGGGAIVLLVAFLVLAALELGFDRRLAIGGAAIAVVLAVALAVGGSSHVTNALEDGPVGLRKTSAAASSSPRNGRPPAGSLRSWSSAEWRPSSPSPCASAGRCSSRSWPDSPSR